ncbi:MAG: HDOD domain-containing protein [Campylobacterota bacterium]|nr:HDOD domain-containing protein [Campylobacterota bacterium]
MKNSIIENVKSLPPLEKTILDVQRVYNDADSSIHDMVKAVEHDPMIVTNLLKAANSPLYFLGKEIEKASVAVSLFGMSMTRSIVLNSSIRKLLKVDMEPYNISPDRFAEISNLQASLMMSWFKRVDRARADKLYMAAFLQETGKILISNQIVLEDLVDNFKSEIETAFNIAMIEKSFTGVTTSEITAAIFEHWKFDKEFVDTIAYVDDLNSAPKETKENSIVLNIVKTIIPVNDPLGERSIEQGLKKAEDAGYDIDVLEDEINKLVEKIR